MPPNDRPTGAQLAALVQRLRSMLGITPTQARQLIGGDAVNGRSRKRVADDLRTNLKALKK